MTMQTADELAAEGERIMAAGGNVVFLHPSQEPIAVEQQHPFVRIRLILADGEYAPERNEVNDCVALGIIPPGVDTDR